MKLNNKAFWLLLVIALPAVISVLCFKNSTIPIYFSIILILIDVLLLLAYFRRHQPIKGKGIASLFLTLLAIFTIELVLRSFDPAKLPREVVIAPPLTTADRGNIVLRKNGFRGKRPCHNCPSNSIRIFTTGGSSTFGTPLFYSKDTYSSQLQRLLDEGRPREHYEVLNAGIPGYGITQILDSLEKEVLKFKPDIVMVCAWFNDSSSIPNWYSLGSQSDMDAYRVTQLLEKIGSLPGFKALYSSRLAGVLRYAVVLFRKKISEGTTKSKMVRTRKRPRMTPEEFKAALEKLQELSIKHNFLPVIIYEPLNRTARLTVDSRGYKYYRAETEIAEKYGMPIVDTLEPYEKHREEWLFADFIHPNRYGHQLTAEAIYEKLFSSQQTDRSKLFWSKKQVDIAMPNTKEFHLLQIDNAAARDKDLNLKIRFPYAAREQEVRLFVDGNFWKVAGIAGNEVTALRTTLHNLPHAKPIVDIIVKAGDNTKGQSYSEIIDWSIEEPISQSAN